MENMIIHTREYREKLLTDPYRPTYHFAIPDDAGFPGDPNGAFFVDGVYHLMYLYRNVKTKGFHWGHMSSVDLLHWRHHADALTVYGDDEGAFSGGGFVDEDKTAYLSFWKLPSKTDENDKGGAALAFSKPPYEKWERIEPIVIKASSKKYGTADMEINGEIKHVACADPSNIWKNNGYYYMQMGNLCVLDEYGRKEDSPECYKGGWTDLFRSKDLKTWEYAHRFYDNTPKGEDWPDATEDDMCPNFLPLYDKRENGNKTDKFLQLFISHNKGCQYFIGTLDGETFIPEKHGRMAWKDAAYFAPEALVDDKCRQIIWTWIRGGIEKEYDIYGWTGVFSFPKQVWFENEMLHMAPIKELDLIEYNKSIPEISDDNSVSVCNDRVFRLKAEIDMTNLTKSGFSVFVSEDGKNHTDIYYDKENQKLVFDMQDSGEHGWKIKEEAPFELGEDETLKLDIFADKSIVEVYANERQSICRRVFVDDPEETTKIKLIGKKENVRKIEISDMAPTNPY